ncbi:glycosyltransferase family 2 protein [Empedobacter falsenii]|uniref:Glycosyltransferase n=1 Tax=Empedobacter falsenii TaxID=343874 RepID=A0AAW7DNZ4_9FLAO|nr:glycosyltransferase [Empedobacter falsenii]MDM1551971.1 glycosyltransferase [Empedobacter falsenii]
MKVSISTPTYGQESYIVDTIKGVLSQQYNGEIEFIITNDNSPDDTDNVIKNFLATAKIPTNIIIKYIKHEANKGAIPNFAWTISQCTGKYIAICEGDDYWTDPLKLQKQVDFLEDNEDCVLCFHKVNILKTNDEIVEDFITKVPENYQYRETLAKNSNYIHTPSVLFKNVIKDKLNIPEFTNSPIGDYFLYLLLTKYGKIGYLQEIMAVYRHGVGVYSSLNLINKVKKEILLFSNLYAYEKDSNLKQIFYNNMESSLSYLINALEVNENKSRLLETRRHILIEKIYRLLKFQKK